MQNSSRLLYAALALWSCLLTSAAADESADSVESLLREAEQAASAGESEKSVGLLNRVVERDPRRAEAYYMRGREHFRLNKIDESCADFDKYIELRPDAASRQWERGISLYYAGRFADGAKQFEHYQTFHSNDVENSVWRYLCVARAEGLEKAKATVLPIENDERVPMMEIYGLYRGEKKPADVLAAAEAVNADPERVKSQRFYAHLYLGLWYEAAGDTAAAAKHLRKAAAISEPNRSINRYMWDVVRIHVERLD